MCYTVIFYFSLYPHPPLCRKEPIPDAYEEMTTVQVLSAIVKFSPEQVSAIIKAEERKQSLLAPLGLS